jgi:anti-sigma B factor antagonist
MSKLAIETDVTQEAALVKLKGRVDSDTAPELDSALGKLLSDGRNKIVLDLQGMEYMSSAGLRSLVKALKSAKSAGGDVHLAAASKDFQGVLLTVGMMQMFKMFSTSEEAAAGF